MEDEQIQCQQHGHQTRECNPLPDNRFGHFSRASFQTVATFLAEISVGQTFLSAISPAFFWADRNVCPTVARNAG